MNQFDDEGIIGADGNRRYLRALTEEQCEQIVILRCLDEWKKNETDALLRQWEIVRGYQGSIGLRLIQGMQTYKTMWRPTLGEAYDAAMAQFVDRMNQSWEQSCKSMENNSLPADLDGDTPEDGDGNRPFAKLP